MLMRPPDKAPDDPPRGWRKADKILLALTIAAFVLTVTMLAYALTF